MLVELIPSFILLELHGRETKIRSCCQLVCEVDRVSSYFRGWLTPAVSIFIIFHGAAPLPSGLLAPSITTGSYPIPIGTQ